MTKRRRFSGKFKATEALEALRGDKTAQEITAKHKFHPTQVTTWKRQAINGLTGYFPIRSGVQRIPSGLIRLSTNDHQTKHFPSQNDPKRRYEQQPDYILAKPQNCPKKQGYFSCLIEVETDHGPVALFGAL